MNVILGSSFLYLNSESGVRIDVWQGEEIGGPDEEVSVEGVQGQAAGAADPHHRLEPDLPGQVTSEHETVKMDICLEIKGRLLR